MDYDLNQAYAPSNTLYLDISYYRNNQTNYGFEPGVKINAHLFIKSFKYSYMIIDSTFAYFGSIKQFIFQASSPNQYIDIITIKPYP